MSNTKITKKLLALWVFAVIFGAVSFGGTNTALAAEGVTLSVEYLKSGNFFPDFIDPDTSEDDTTGSVTIIPIHFNTAEKVKLSVSSANEDIFRLLGVTTGEYLFYDDKTITVSGTGTAYVYGRNRKPGMTSVSVTAGDANVEAAVVIAPAYTKIKSIEFHAPYNQINWEPTAGADGYIIRKYAYGDDFSTFEYETVAEITDGAASSASIFIGKPAEKGRYLVTPYVDIGTEKVASISYNGRKLRYMLPQHTMSAIQKTYKKYKVTDPDFRIRKVSAEGSNIALTWRTEAGVDAYNLYRSEDESYG